MKSIQQYQVFIASPGDVQPEREIVREVCAQLNCDPLCAGSGASFSATGWEDSLPAGGEPQLLINHLAKACDIFVCIFHKRFGTPTGRAASGTAEEFWLAYDLWKNTQKPHILFYFKEIHIASAAEFQDPQIQQVFELKEKIERDRLLLFSPFSDTDQFRDLLTLHLKQWLAQTPAASPITDSGWMECVPAEIPENYCRWIAGNCATVEAEKLYGKGEAFPLRLPEIFIPLYADDPGEKKRIRPGRVKADGENFGMAEKQPPVDLETLIGRYESLLIEGQAGSGKTTLMKHLACGLSGQEAEVRPPPELEGYLPVLILLRDIERFFRDAEAGGKRSPTGKEALEWYFALQMENLLPLDVLDRFLDAGQVIFLVDGLDEIRLTHRDAMVQTISNMGLRHRGNRIVLAGRPHGLEGAVLRKFGDRRARIHLLAMEQVHLFIRKWFDYLYPGAYATGRKDAEAMIADVKSHPATETLVHNPLMLTAVCILYHDNKELPDQRAELYKKFIDNMLYRRFANDPEPVHDFLATLAFDMHTRRARAVDRSFILSVMRAVYAQKQGESEKQYNKRLAQTFEDLEPRCGLLRPEKGQYAFWHLTFQEFLTADYLVDNTPATELVAVVEPYWTDEWFREVVELYVGYLCLNNKQIANDVVTAGAAAGDGAPFARWRLAGRALIDIPENRRLKPTEKVVVQRMLEIIEAAAEPLALADAGEILGRLGDSRNLKAFIDVPGGSYTFKERGKLDVDPFAIGKYPVTNAWFAEFIAAGGYAAERFWTPEGRKWLKYTGATHPQFWNDRKWIGPNAPVVGVCWYEAAAFCRWLTNTCKNGIYVLPDDNQWEAAAAGKRGREYPWKAGWKDGICNTKESKIAKTSAVGVFPASDTPEGVSDLAGNVWEWTRTDYSSKKVRNDFEFDPEVQKLFDLWYATQDKNEEDEIANKIRSRWKERKSQMPALRGGSWFYPHGFARCAARFWNGPDFRIFFVGFRCARTQL